MCCDQILPPAKPDRDTISSVHGLLTAVLPLWLAYRKTVLKQAERLAQDDLLIPDDYRHWYTLPRHPPRVLPVIVVGFKASKRKVKGFNEDVYVYRTASDVILTFDKVHVPGHCGGACCG